MLLIRNDYIKPMAGDDISGGNLLIGDDGKTIIELSKFHQTLE